MSFKFLIFPDFVDFEIMQKGTFLRGNILDLFINNWPSDRMKFKDITIRTTNLVLI